MSYVEGHENFAELLSLYGLPDTHQVLAEKGEQVDINTLSVQVKEEEIGQSEICHGCNDNCRGCEANPLRVVSPRAEKIKEIRRSPHYKQR
jgi:hypothetical protein